MPVDPFDPAEFGFPEGSPIFSYPPDARRAINEARMRIQGSQAYLRFWERVLTPKERDELGNDVEACFQANPININLLCRQRTWIPERSVVEIASRLNFLTSADYEWLRQVIGDPVPGDPVTPSWDRGTGQLTFQGQQLRQINVRAATLIVPILDAFEEQGWPSSLESPIDTSIDRQRIHDAVSNLNRSLKTIRFRVQGDSICWSR